MKAFRPLTSPELDVSTLGGGHSRSLCLSWYSVADPVYIKGISISISFSYVSS